MSTFPPQPKLTDITSVQWMDWLNRVRNSLGVGGISFNNLDFTGSNLTSITVRNHNDLTSKQGGSTGEYYHLSQFQHDDLTDSGDSSLHYHSSDRARANHIGTQPLATISDVTITATNLNSLDDGVDYTLHFHSSDRDRTNHTGTQDHNNTLSGKQGGTTSEFYHLTQAEYAELQRQDNVSSVSANTSLDDNHDTVLVTASTKTITLPAASTARIGKSWTVILGTTGYVDITRAGSDTINLPTSNTTIRLRTKGASVTLRCLTATSWGIV